MMIKTFSWTITNKASFANVNLEIKMSKQQLIWTNAHEWISAQTSLFRWELSLI